MAARAGRRERQRAQTRQKLYEAAMRLFAERGFFDTTTEDITEAADVGQGTFFNYFPSKQHVLAALGEVQVQKIIAARHEAEGGRTAIRELLRRLVHNIAKEPGRSEALTRSLFSALLSSDAVRGMFGAGLARGRGELAAIMALGQERGEVNKRCPTAEHALAFQRCVLGTLFLWAVHERGGLNACLKAAFADFWAATSAPLQHAKDGRPPQRAKIGLAGDPGRAGDPREGRRR
jgi:AcrR family transcriptional regulator